MEDAKIAQTLGRIEGGITAAKEEMQRFREESVRQTDEAARGRQRIYTSINEFKDRVGAELSAMKSKQQLLDMRVEDLRNAMSVLAPAASEMPVIRTAVAELKSGHEKINESVRALNAIKDQIQGGLTISKLWWGGFVAIVIGVSSAASAVVTAVWHYLMSSPSPPGR